jgi:hypothetical protein
MRDGFRHIPDLSLAPERFTPSAGRLHDAAMSCRSPDLCCVVGPFA